MTLGIPELGQAMWHAHVTDLPPALRRVGRIRADSSEWHDLAMDIIEFCHPRGLLSADEISSARHIAADGGFGAATPFFTDLLSTEQPVTPEEPTR